MTRAIALRRALGAAVAGLFVVAIACAEKTLAPSLALSPRFTIRVTATAQRTAEAQKIFVVAGYFRTPPKGQNAGDSVYFLDTATVDITGGPQQVNLKVDLTTCLADPSRHGSKDACTMYIGAYLEPSTFDPDSSDFFGPSYDFQLRGPFDATPGHPPLPPAIDLSVTHFAVNQWEADSSLQLGGYQAPGGITGPITGAAASGSGAPTLFALAQGANSRPNPNGISSGAAQLGVYQNGVWRKVDGPFGNSFFVDVAAFAPNDAYMVANTTGLYHYDGTTVAPISGVSPVAGELLRSVSVSSASSTRFLIAGANANGSVWVGNLSGTPSFTKYSIAGLTSVDGVCINSATEAFATSRASNSSVYRFDGTSWTSVQTPSTAGKMDLQCLGPGQVYVGTAGSPGTLYRLNAGSWTALLGPSGATGRTMNWAVVSPTEMYAVGDSGNTNRAFYRFDGTSWREIGRSTFSSGSAPNRIWADPRGGAAYVSTTAIVPFTRIDMVTPTSVNVITYNPFPRDVAMPTTTSAFVVGSNFFLARWNGARWSVDAPPAGTASTPMLNGVWAGDPTNVWAVGQQSTIVRWDGTRWNVLSDSKRPIVPTTDNYNAAWGIGGSVWTVGDATIVRCTTTTNCAVASSPSGGALYGVWGASATDIYAVGAGGRILHFDGASWTSMSSPTVARLSRVSGSGANDVWAAGDTVVLHFDGSAWKPMTATVSDLTPFPGYQSPVAAGIPLPVGLWAVSAHEVYFGTWDGRIRRGEGSNWGTNLMTYRGLTLVNAISGTVGGCALALTDGLNRAGGGSPRLLRGVGASGCLATPMSPPTSWP